MSTFDKVVESVKKLSLDEKEELHLLLERYLAEARRDEINTHFEESKAEYKKKKPQYTSDINKLKKSL